MVGGRKGSANATGIPASTASFVGVVHPASCCHSKNEYIDIVIQKAGQKETGTYSMEEEHSSGEYRGGSFGNTDMKPGGKWRPLVFWGP